MKYNPSYGPPFDPHMYTFLLENLYLDTFFGLTLEMFRVGWSWGTAPLDASSPAAAAEAAMMCRAESKGSRFTLQEKQLQAS
eukprot:5438498-Amphidinium_carterae.2